MMPLYDYACEPCGTEEERMSPIADRHSQTCRTCGGVLSMIFKPQPRYVPFNGYFDIGLGAEVTSWGHRRRLMREIGVDHRDPPSPGAQSARKDWCMETRKEREYLTGRKR